MSSVRMSSAQMLLKVLSSSESFAGASNTIGMGAVEWSSSWANAFFVHFAHMPQKTAAVGKARVLLAGWFTTFVGSLMFVHMLIPFTWSAKGFCLVTACVVSANYLAVVISRWLSLRTSRVRFYGVARRRYVSVWCHCWMTLKVQRDLEMY